MRCAQKMHRVPVQRGRRRLTLDDIDPVIGEEALKMAGPGPSRIDVVDEDTVVVTNKYITAQINRS